MLTAERLRQVLDYNPKTGAFTWKVSTVRIKAGTPAGYVMKANRYVYINVDYKAYRAHRLAILWMTGEWPADLVDHIDCNRSNNRWSNIRLADKCQNTWNRSNVRGIAYDRDSWEARIMVRGKRHFLGRFSTAEEASEAYRLASETYRGRFANPARR